MRHFVRNLMLVVLVMVLAGLAIWPPSRSLRLGKDLQGGTSLIYAVQIDPGQDATSVLNQMINVLKDRVDPTGTKDISMVPQGRDRIAISFPQSSDRVKALRDEYEQKLAALGSEVVTGPEFENAMDLPEGSQRAEAFQEIAAGDQDRLNLLQEAARALDAAKAARAQYEQLEPRLRELEAQLEEARQLSPEGEADQERVTTLEAQIAPLREQVNTLVAQIAESEIRYDDLRAEILESAVRPEEVRQALQRSNRPIIMFDKSTREAVEIPSPRDQALTAITDAHPDLADEIAAIEDAYDTYTSQATGFDDPADMVRLLKAAGILDFRITVDPGTHPEEQRLRMELRTVGPRNVQSTDTVWLPIDKVVSFVDSVQALRNLKKAPAAYFEGSGYVVEPYQGEYYMLAWDVRGNRLLGGQGHWSVARAYQGRDQLGRPAISFEMDPRGSALLGDLTGAHIGDNMAVILDDRVITAPRINAQISRSGIIEGQFTPEELSTIIRVMNAGSLQARLSPEPISISTLGPERGADNLRSGLRAGMYALAGITVFMIAYYYFCGLIGIISLCCNGTLLLAAMALSEQAFTLPGIAGVILTFGVGMDGNVLIYERLREEIRAGHDIRTSVRLGYSRAMSSIVDGNVTNLIVCLVLYQVGTPEIKGFALTLGIGVVTTMFANLFISHVLFDVLLDWVGVRKLSMLALTFPIIDRILTPNIDWMRGRWVYMCVSGAYIIGAIVLVWSQGTELLDLEFRGGTMVELVLTEPETGEPHAMTRSEVADRVHTIGVDAPDDSALSPLRGAEVVPKNPQADGVTSDQFLIRTLSTDQGAVKNAIVAAFDTYLAGYAPLTFEAMDVENADAAPVYPIITGRLGEDTDHPGWRADVSEYLGGAAIIVGDIQPAPTLDALRARLDLMRAQPDFSQTLAREREIIILEGDADAVQTAAIVVQDALTNYFEDERAWGEEVAQTEWDLVREALTRATTPAAVRGFSPAIAETFRAQAIVSIVLSCVLIMVYIWIRFGYVRYAMGTIVSLSHDVIAALGMIAVANILYDWGPTEALARSLGIMPFKIDLTVVAALLTLAGYSINDTIVTMDRVRENRGKLSYASRRVINLSINETLSRTVWTGGTILLSVTFLYIGGGESLRAFAYTLLMGFLFGTYSTICIAPPFLWSRSAEESESSRKALGRNEDDEPPRL